MKNEYEDFFWIVDNSFKIISANNAFWQFINGPELSSQPMMVGYTNWNESYTKALNGEHISILEKVYDSIRKKIQYRVITFDPVINRAGSVYGVSCFSKNITKRKAEEQQVKLLESVINNTNEAVIITKSEQAADTCQRIVYVNRAFTSITGYTAEEALGNTLALLYGPKSDAGEITLLNEAIAENRSYELTSIIYKKSGVAFWLNVSMNPVTNEKNTITHWIALAKDVTEWKNQELQKTLLVEISNLFRQQETLNIILGKVLNRLLSTGECYMGEIWLIDNDHSKLRLAARSPQSDAAVFHGQDVNVKGFALNKGSTGFVFKTANNPNWHVVKQDDNGYGNVENIIEKGYSVPIVNNDTITGFFVLGLKTDNQVTFNIPGLLKVLGIYAGAEIKRKQQEQELNLIFKFAPDIIAIVGLDGYFKKINPAGCDLLEYSEEELLAVPFANFIHPDDKKMSSDKINDTDRRKSIFMMENRYISRSGKTKWLSWTSSPAVDGEFIFSVAKNITDKKDLENLLNKATSLANIGSWEVDLLKKTLYWSKITRKIHEVNADFEPKLETAINFYKEGKNRALINEKLEQAIDNGTPWDIELQIVTAKNNEKWIRVIGEAEFIKGNCVKLYGSFQDIDTMKKAELAVIQTLTEKNTIL